jgi:hypothetical protein
MCWPNGARRCSHPGALAPRCIDRRGISRIRRANTTPHDVDVEALVSALCTVDTHLEAAVVDHDSAALVFLLEGLIPLARVVGDNRIRLLVATGVLTDEEIGDWVAKVARRNPPPTGLRRTLVPRRRQCRAHARSGF